MNTTAMPADTAEPLSSHRDDPDPSDQPESADADPPEPASEQPSELRPFRGGIGADAVHEKDRIHGDAAPTESDDPAVTIDSSDDVPHEIDYLWLDGQLRNIFMHLSAPVERVSIRIVCDAEMTDLNRRFHHADDTTDVLTFADNPPGAAIDADLALCADEAARHAAARGHSIERELLLYALHGLLHCCGFADHDDDSFAAMHAEEDRILDAIGVGATFGDRRSGEA